MSVATMPMAFPPPGTTMVYPRTSGSVPSSSSSAHSRGSFGPVFVVLAVITVLAAGACFVGRIFAQRYLRTRTRRDNHAFVPRGQDVEGGGAAAGGNMPEMVISGPVNKQGSKKGSGGPAAGKGEGEGVPGDGGAPAGGPVQNGMDKPAGGL